MATSTTGTVLSGLASNIDWTSLVNSLMTIERSPETQWKSQIATISQKNAAYQTIGSDLSKLQTDISALTDPSLFNSRTASSSNPIVASATVTSGAPAGNYNFTVKQLATPASQSGVAVSAQAVVGDGDPSTISLGSPNFATAIKSGTFTVNGQTITVATSDTLQSVFDQIQDKTGGAVTATYDSATDKITLAPAAPEGTVTVGSAADTSNFLQATGLFNNAGAAITSAQRMGTINIYAKADAAGLDTGIANDPDGAGGFTINGVAISFDATDDSINDIMGRINASAAGVTATYDSVNHKFSLVNETTGDVGITLSDTKGNFLAATGLLAGSFNAGENLQYTINGSSTLYSSSNTVSGAAVGIVGMTITAQDVGSSTISVNTDTATIASAITAFVNDYNTVQNFIKSQTASTVDSSGNTVPGLLTGDFDISQISSQLRQMADAVPASATGAIKSITDLGIASNGQDNTFALNAAALNTALAKNLDSVKQLFTTSGTGLARTLNKYLLATIGGNGPLMSKEASFTKQTASLNTSISQLESKISLDQAAMENEFVQMEDAIAKSNTAKQYLTAYFNSNSASAAPSASSVKSGSTSSG